MEEKVEKKYKDTVFRMLFREKRELLSLYNAVNGTAYDDPEDLEVVTLENAVYMNMKNDVACILDMRLQLYEHQSTVNPNMPLRDLFYVARELEAYIARNEENIYSRKLIQLPTPRFVVFYNGEETMPERTRLYLSDAFAMKKEEKNLELVVDVFNVNLGNNEELLNACNTLREYCIYVNRVRKYAKKMPIEAAVDRAVTECINENILKEFLISQRAEAKAMSIYEYNEEKTLKSLGREWFEDGWKQGEAKGREQGKAEGLQEGREQGKAEGIQEGHEQGKAEGIQEGREQGKAEGIQEGHEQGKAEGLQEGRMCTLLQFLQNGGTKENAMKFLGATEEELEALEKE